MAWLAITVLLLVVYALLIRYYHGHFKKLPTFSADGFTPSTFVSVIVAARNEEKNLPQLLQALFAQTYPPHLFEIIIVDDFSTDSTAAAVQPFLQTQNKTFSKPHIHLIQPDVAANRSSKKRAIEAGVKQGHGPLLLITDADCVPPKDWTKTMAAFYEQKNAVFIAAPVRFTHNNSILQTFQALDFLTLQGITAAAVGAGFHSMCNGANLAYTKQAFQNVNGFEGIDHIASGDDMLLMHKIWLQHQTAVHYLKSTDAIVSTPPMYSWRDFIGQRRRWASKTVHYRDKRVFWVLLFVYLFNVWFLVLLIATFSNAHAGWFSLGFLLFKTAIEWPFVNHVAAFYGDQKIMRYFLLLQPLHILYTISVGLLSQLPGYEWKRRRTK